MGQEKKIYRTRKSREINKNTDKATTKEKLHQDRENVKYTAL